MNFRPELAEAVVAGRKTVTRRAVSDNPRSPYSPDRAPTMEGKRIAICPGRGKVRVGEATVVRVTRETFDPTCITREEAEAEGLIDPSSFRMTWYRLHKSLDPVDVWRIELSDPQEEERTDG